MDIHNALIIGGKLDFNARNKEIKWNLRKKNENLGETDLTYVIWFDISYVKLKIIIIKDSKEGVDFVKWLRVGRKKTDEMVKEQAWELVKPFFTFENFKDYIKRAENYSYHNGKTDTQKELRKALGIS